MFIFYESDLPTSFIYSSTNTRLFYADGQASAFYHGMYFGTELIASDSMNSSLMSVRNDQLRALPHTVFGFYRSLGELPVGFNGERHDAVTRMYSLGAGYRWYSPLIMRFTSPDTISPFGEGGTNAYSYVKNDPVNYRDPDGHDRRFRLQKSDYNYYRPLKKIAGWGDRKRGIFQTERRWFRKPKLIGSVHGNQESGTVLIGNERKNPEQFADWLSANGINSKNYRKFTLLGCYMGASPVTGEIFAQALANVLKIPVKAPTQRVYAHAWKLKPTSLMALRMRITPEEHHSVNKTSYTLKTFYPQVEEVRGL